jgi:hypothetical protein
MEHTEDWDMGMDILIGRPVDIAEDITEDIHGIFKIK